jgi:hypothetical protein
MLTIEEIKPANIGEIRPEFGTTIDVRKYYGIKKGTLYNLFTDKKIEGKVLRVRGEVKGVRLWDMDSIRRFIESSSDSFDDESENEKAPVEPGQVELNGELTSFAV